MAKTPARHVYLLTVIFEVDTDLPLSEVTPDMIGEAILNRGTYGACPEDAYYLYTEYDDGSDSTEADPEED